MEGDQLLSTIKRFLKRFIFTSRKKVLFPWYDGEWLSSYIKAKKYFKNKLPHRLRDFENSMQLFRTRLDFKIQKIDRVFDASIMTEINSLIKNLKNEEFELHEWDTFGRRIIHDHPFFDHLQLKLTELVSEAVKEEVEPCYNFLSLYNRLGICPVHLDAPSAKWTLDICLNRSVPWPIYFSAVEPWPETFKYLNRSNWQTQIKKGRSFDEYILKPGEGIIFSGSSQWHYRNPIKNPMENDFCNLVFFHFIPKGSAKLSNPGNWARHFETPKLLDLTVLR